MQSIATQRLPKQQIRVMFDRARELEEQGRKIIHLEIGRPDFDTPPHIVEAAVQALREGKHHYSANAGLIELRRAVADKYQRPAAMHRPRQTSSMPAAIASRDHCMHSR